MKLVVVEKEIMRNNRKVVCFYLHRESQSSSNSHEPWVSTCCFCAIIFVVIIIFFQVFLLHIDADLTTPYKICLITNVHQIAQMLKAVFICCFGAW